MKAFLFCFCYSTLGLHKYFTAVYQVVVGIRQV